MENHPHHSNFNIELTITIHSVFPYSKHSANNSQTRSRTVSQTRNYREINDTEWAAGAFITPTKDKTVRFLTDFRELNKCTKRKP